VAGEKTINMPTRFKTSLQRALVLWLFGVILISLSYHLALFARPSYLKIFLWFIAHSAWYIVVIKKSGKPDVKQKKLLSLNNLVLYALHSISGLVFLIITGVLFVILGVEGYYLL